VVNKLASKLLNQELIERINKRLELARNDTYELRFYRALDEALEPEINNLDGLVWNAIAQARNAEEIVKGNRPMYHNVPPHDAYVELKKLKAENEELKAERKKLMDQKFEYEVETGILKD